MLSTPILRKLLCDTREMKRARSHLREDGLIILLSLVAAWAIVHYDLVHAALQYTGDGVLWASLIAGAFFTSVVTTAPAIAVLGELSQEGNMYAVALVGAFGAVLGDFIIFLFVRDRITRDATFMLRGPRIMRVLHIFKHRHFRRVLPIVGALIIASPLPDELGLALLGLSKINNRYFFVISYTMNALGILLIGFAARGLGW